MPSPAERDLTRLPCPLCSEESGLELALRLELEAEAEVVFAACPACNRLYEITPGGAMHIDTEGRPGLMLQAVSCPQCFIEGYAVSMALPPGEAESHVFMTCRACNHTFQPPGAAALPEGTG